jgi:hypothetical protein
MQSVWLIAQHTFRPADNQRRGFDGRWGEQCEDDPNNRRSGIQITDFGAALIRDLAFYLASVES